MSASGDRFRGRSVTNFAYVAIKTSLVERASFRVDEMYCPMGRVCGFASFFWKEELLRLGAVGSMLDSWGRGV